MAPGKVEWIYRFNVESPLNHPKGFTLYKFTSVVYPKGSPEAGTRIVIWKRYSDFKKLHVSVRRLCRDHKLPPPPCLAPASYFNRFDEKVIESRRITGQRLLEFIGQNKQLFLSEDFVTFGKQGYQPCAMGQGESVNVSSGEFQIDHWRWTDETRWSSESSDDESGPPSTTSSSSPLATPSHNNNVTHHSEPAFPTNNNNTDLDPLVFAPLQDSLEVVDVAGCEDKVLEECPGGVQQQQLVVICSSEHPVLESDLWMSVPDCNIDAALTPVHRLAAYRVVGFMKRILLVVHCSRPEVKLVLKVHRKSCWPEALLPSVGDPRPVPNMVRLIDWIETEDAIFVITEYVSCGLLTDYVKKNPSTEASTPKLSTPLSSPKFYNRTKISSQPSEPHPSESVIKVPIENRFKNDISTNLAMDCPHQNIDLVNADFSEKSKSIPNNESIASVTNMKSSYLKCERANPSHSVLPISNVSLKANQQSTVPVSSDAFDAPTSEEADVGALVQQAQRLLASVSRTLQLSAAQQDQLEDVETVLEPPKRKPRSKSVLPRPRLERRFSCDDATGVRPRTAHPSLDRARHRVPRAAEAAVKEWGAALVAALETLHNRGIIWRDLHTDNLLSAGSGRLILTHHHRWGGVEPRVEQSAIEGMFVAPEVQGVFPITAAADWWSLGVILYQLLTGLTLSDMHPQGMSWRTAVDLPEELSAEAKSLLSGLLKVEVTERLGSSPYGAEELKCHPFFHDVDWDAAYGFL